MRKLIEAALFAAAFTLLVGAQAAQANPGGGVDWGGGDGGGRGHTVAAPAPLLAAGIPAFAALGGFVAIGKLRRKFTRQV